MKLGKILIKRPKAKYLENLNFLILLDSLSITGGLISSLLMMIGIARGGCWKLMSDSVPKTKLFSKIPYLG